MFKKIKKWLWPEKEDVVLFKPDFTDTDLTYKDSDKINFIYGQAIKYAEELAVGNKLIADRGILLLYYLIPASAWLITFILSKVMSPDITNKFFLWGSILIFTSYTVITLVITWCCIMPKPWKPVTNEPKNLLIKKVMFHDLKTIKFQEIINLQNRINRNYNSLRKSFKVLHFSVIATIITPLTIIVIIAISYYSFLLFSFIFFR